MFLIFHENIRLYVLSEYKIAHKVYSTKSCFVRRNFTGVLVDPPDLHPFSGKSLGNNVIIL